MKKMDIGCCGDNARDKAEKTGGILIQPSMEVFRKKSIPEENVKDFDRPGYRANNFVHGFLIREDGAIPQVKTSLDGTDLFSSVLVRMGIRRHDYKISPGLYCIGTPDKNSEVLVTANFKLTFDYLRKELEGISAWMLVLDTNGVNVWCAAGKKTFSTKELVKGVKTASLEKIVSHKRLIVPQLGATGICAGEVRKQSGFEVIYGPIRAKDIPLFLSQNRKADDAMRKVTFTLLERLVLTPVELNLVVKPAFITAVVLLLISGIGPGLFSISQAWSRWLLALYFLVAGIISGVIITPMLLPFIPFKEFAAKGIIPGIIFALLVVFWSMPASSGTIALVSLSIFTVTVSSILAMHFTGATPFTSPSGVEKEMRKFIPVQALGLLLFVGFFIYSAF